MYVGEKRRDTRGGWESGREEISLKRNARTDGARGRERGQAFLFSSHPKIAATGHAGIAQAPYQPCPWTQALFRAMPRRAAKVRGGGVWISHGSDKLRGWAWASERQGRQGADHLRVIPDCPGPARSPLARVLSTWSVSRTPCPACPLVHSPPRCPPKQLPSGTSNLVPGPAAEHVPTFHSSSEVCLPLDVPSSTRGFRGRAVMTGHPGP
jgi:hypothetical protein